MWCLGVEALPPLGPVWGFLPQLCDPCSPHRAVKAWGAGYRVAGPTLPPLTQLPSCGRSLRAVDAAWIEDWRVPKKR